MAFQGISEELQVADIVAIFKEYFPALVAPRDHMI